MENFDDRYSLKWSNFRSNFMDGFHDFLQKEMMVDVTLAAEGKFVQAHKLVLSVCSPYFKNLFKVNPCKHPIVILKDVGHTELSCMLQFMYKGEANVKLEDLPSFLKLADTLKVRGLIEENIQIEKNNVASVSRLRKRKSKTLLADSFEGNSDSESCVGDKKENKTKRVKSRRLTPVLDCVKKIKRKDCDEKCLESDGGGKKKSVDVCSDGIRGSEEDDSNPLANLLIDKIQNYEDKKLNTSIVNIKNEFCGDSNEDSSDNKKFAEIDRNDEDKKSDGDADEVCEFETVRSLCSFDNSTESEQTPQEQAINYHDMIPCTPRRCTVCAQSKLQRRTRWMCSFCKVPLCIIKTRQCFDYYHRKLRHLSSMVFSRTHRAFVWDYFLKETNRAVCLDCGKTFKGQRPNTICEQHLKKRHPESYRVLLEKKIKRAELHMTPLLTKLGLPSK